MPKISDAIALIDHCYRIIPVPGQEPAPPCKYSTDFVPIGDPYGKGQDDPYGSDFGQMYINRETNEAIYVSRGTFDMNKTRNSDWIEDLVGIPTKDGCKSRIMDGVNNIRDAMIQYPELKQCKITVAGHSLGGFIAQGICKELGLKGVAINSPTNIDVQTPNALLIANQKDFTGSLGHTAPNLITLPDTLPELGKPAKKTPVEAPFHELRDFVQSVFEIVGSFFGGHHAAEENVGDKLKDAARLDYSLLTDANNVTEKRSMISEVSAMEGATVRFGGVQEVGSPKIDPVLPQVSIVVDKSRLEDSPGKGSMGVNFSINVGDVVKSAEELFNNIVHFFDGEKKQSISTEGGDQLCEIDESGNLINTKKKDADEERQSPGDPQSSKKEKEELKSSIQSFSSKKSTDSNLVSIMPAENKALKQMLRSLGNINCHVGIEGAYELFIKTNHPSVTFYKKATEVSGSDQVKYLSRLFGQWLKPGEKAETGDWVFVQSVFIKEAQAWGVMVEYQDEHNMEVLLTDILTSKLAKGLPMSILKAFRPTLSTVIKENTPEDIFWGPIMSYLKYFIETPAIDKADTFIAKLMKHGEYDIDSIEGFNSHFANEIKQVNQPTDIPFGAIVTGEQPGSVGIMLSSYEIHGLLGAVDFANTKWYSLAEFKPKSYWMPHKKQ